MAVISFLRKLQYQELSSLRIDGKILDLGGSKKSGYHELIKGDHQITVVNIDENCGADLKFDIEETFPLESESFDAVICLNVLEHIYDYNKVLLEIYRVLKKDGKLIGAVPFLLYVHPSPNDYFRFTNQALQKIFQVNGFEEINIKELGSGLFGVLYQLKISLYRFHIISQIALIIHIIFDKIFKLIKPRSYISEKYFPLGYFFTAQK